MTMDQVTPAGWYPDPRGGHMRYWDGARWTEHSSPLPQSTPARGPAARSTMSTRDLVILAMLFPAGLVVTAFDVEFGLIMAVPGAIVLAFLLLRTLARST